MIYKGGGPFLFYFLNLYWKKNTIIDYIFFHKEYLLKYLVYPSNLFIFFFFITMVIITFILYIYKSI
jgi:hypothetical protein